MSRGLTNRQADAVIINVADKHKISPEAIKGRVRTREVCAARRQVWRDLVDGLGASTVEAGLATGHDHSTVLYGLGRVERHRKPLATFTAPGMMTLSARAGIPSAVVEALDGRFMFLPITEPTPIRVAIYGTAEVLR